MNERSMWNWTSAFHKQAQKVVSIRQEKSIADVDGSSTEIREPP